MLDHLKSFCAALATRGPVRLRVEVNVEAWRTLRAEFHRPYKHEPNAGFTLYLEGGAGTVEFVPENDAPVPVMRMLEYGMIPWRAPPPEVPEPLTQWKPVPPPTEGDA